MSWRIGLIDRIQLDNQTGCWNWRGAKNSSGYGIASYLGKVVNAHRLSAHLWLKLPLGDKRQVLHRCDNPSCFNPKHLFLGTQADNLLDMSLKRRHWQQQKTHCKHGHPFEGNCYIKKTRIGIGRQCKTCLSISNAKRANLDSLRG
jgi:hypothetical protein